MAVPKYRKSKATIMKRRRQNDKRSLQSGATCPECGSLKMPHRVCDNCGAYKGRTVINKD